MNARVRITTDEFAELARVSRGTVLRRVRAREYPRPVDRCAEGYLFDYQACLRALGVAQSDEVNPFEEALNA